MDITTLRAKPGDVVVITFPRHTDPNLRDRQCERLRAALDPAVLLVALPEGSTLTVLTDDSLAHLGLERRRADAPPPSTAP